MDRRAIDILNQYRLVQESGFTIFRLDFKDYSNLSHGDFFTCPVCELPVKFGDVCDIYLARPNDVKKVTRWTPVREFFVHKKCAKSIAKQARLGGYRLARIERGEEDDGTERYGSKRRMGKSRNGLLRRFERADR